MSNHNHFGSVMSMGQIEINPKDFGKKASASDLPILPTRNLVLFPGVNIPISITREKSLELAKQASERQFPIGIVCQRDPYNDSPSSIEDLLPFGCIADIYKVIELPDGSHTAIIHGRERFEIIGNGRGRIFPNGISAKVKIYPEEKYEDINQDEFNSIMDVLSPMACELFVKRNNGDKSMATAINNISNPIERLNNIATNLGVDSPEDKVSVLAQPTVIGRAEACFRLILQLKEKIEIFEEIVTKAQTKMAENQREAFLQTQLDTIREELYGSIDADSDADMLSQRADSANMPENVRMVFDRELAKLRRLNMNSPDYSLHYAYLETLVDLPWQPKPSDANISSAAEILEKSHYGVDKINQRILEQIAVILANADAKKIKTPIICLVGPPGVGKTSLGRSIAAAMGRVYQRVALGGVHDESEIRGHRRTYIGAMPGRIIKALKDAGTTNPVILLDEVDKLGKDHRGDPSSALLEVLDPEQNSTFHDNYVDLDFDLSNVLFIATANDISKVDGPLRDRMEIIELSGYLPEEKLEIAKRHLIPKVLADNGIPEDKDFKISDEAISSIIEKYTAESGVRSLEKQLATIVRKFILLRLQSAESKKKMKFPKVIMPENLQDLLGKPKFDKNVYEGNDIPGVVTGLAWTAVGGEILLAEASLSAGKGDKISITGNLGDVMKESAAIALQWVKAHAAQLDIPSDDFEKKSLHIHFPEGAIPKDGPSAGITIATAIASAFTNRKVADRIAMTGEITLRGKVLPVGGIREKILAARRAGINTVILSTKNSKDVEEIPANYLDGLNFVYVDTVDQVIHHALLK